MPTTDTFDELGLLAERLEQEAAEFPEAAPELTARARALRNEQIRIARQVTPEQIAEAVVDHFTGQIPDSQQDIAEEVVQGLQRMACTFYAELPAEAYGAEEYPHAMALEPEPNVSHLSRVRWPVVIAVSLVLDAVAFLIGWGVWRLM